MDGLHEKIHKMTQERDNCLLSIQEYRQEIGRLTDPAYRGEMLDGMSDALGKVSEYISNSED
jgi:hypothetical protein